MTCRCPQLVSLNALALPNLTSPRPLGGCRAAGVAGAGCARASIGSWREPDEPGEARGDLSDPFPRASR